VKNEPSLFILHSSLFAFHLKEVHWQWGQSSVIGDPRRVVDNEAR